MAETATEKMMRQHKDERQRDRMRQSLQAFSERWAPTDQSDIHRFHAELHMLVREIHADAQRPVVDTITNLMRAMPVNIVAPKSI